VIEGLNKSQSHYEKRRTDSGRSEWTELALYHVLGKLPRANTRPHILLTNQYFKGGTRNTLTSVLPSPPVAQAARLLTRRSLYFKHCLAVPVASSNGAALPRRFVVLGTRASAAMQAA